MAGLTGHKNISKGLFDQMLGLEKQIKDDVQEAALEAGIAGQEKIKWVIDHTESSLSREPKDNRNWTWRMNYAVDARVRREGNIVHIRAGWLDVHERYFLYQNDGVDLVRNGVVTVITPMNALMAGHDAMLDKLAEWGIKV